MVGFSFLQDNILLIWRKQKIFSSSFHQTHFFFHKKFFFHKLTFKKNTYVCIFMHIWSTKAQILQNFKLDMYFHFPNAHLLMINKNGIIETWPIMSTYFVCCHHSQPRLAVFCSKKANLLRLPCTSRRHLFVLVIKYSQIRTRARFVKTRSGTVTKRNFVDGLENLPFFFFLLA